MDSHVDFVLDSSVAIAWYFDDEFDTYAVEIAKVMFDLKAIVPNLWRLEIANSILVGERRGRSTPEQAEAWLEYVGSMQVEVDDMTDSLAWSNTIALARERNLSSYDATYLELAMRRGLPLATLDSKLKQAAQSAGVEIFIPTP